MESQHLDRIRRLSQALLISGGLNIGLLALFFYWLVKETPPRPYFELKPAIKQEQQAPLAIDRSNASVILSNKQLPMEQLIAKLTNTQLVENGYTQRDLALAALVTFYHFDMGRALLGKAQPAQKRTIPIGKTADGEPYEITIYPNLTEQQYKAIVHYAHRDRWPLTSKGLFLLLRKQAAAHDPTLEDAFFLTPEFLAVEVLFSRSEATVEKSELLKIVLQGDWSLLSSFIEQQKVSQDLSPARRQRFLLDYIARESRAAAYLLLKTDRLFAIKKITNEQVVAVLNLLVEKTPEAEKYALAQLTSPRSDEVWHLAAKRLYDFSGEPFPEKSWHHAAVMRFVAPHALFESTIPKGMPKVAAAPSVKTPSSETLQPTPVHKPQAPLPNRERAHVVREGDSLWKIAKLYKVDIDRLKEHNKLESDFLKPGTTIKIP